MFTREAWKDQLQHLHKDCYLWSLSCCHYDRETAKDVLQSVYLKIYEGKAMFKQTSTLKTWLFSIIRFTSIDYLRKYGMHVEQISELEDEPSTQTEYDSDRKNWVDKLLLALPGQQREVLTLAFYHDMTLEEIATLLEISVGTVRTHYERGKENFRKNMTLNKLDAELR